MNIQTIANMKTFMSGYENWEMDEGFASEQFNDEDQNWHDVMCRYAWSIYNNDVVDRAVIFCEDNDLDADDFMKSYLMYRFLKQNNQDPKDYMDFSLNEINEVEDFIREY